MKATARIVAESDGRGRTRLAVLSGEAPLLPRRTGSWPATGAAEVHLVGGAAGPLGGDVLHLDIEVGPGAHLVVRTVAASIVLPGLSGAQSTTGVRASVADGGRLRWLPEPVVAARGCRHLASSHVDIAGGGYLVWREEVICGRHGEDSGDLTLTAAVRLDGAPLFQQELAVGPHAPAWAGPAVLGGATAVGSLLVVDPAWAVGHKPVAHAAGPPPGASSTEVPGLGAWVARMPLAGPAVLTSAVALEAHTLRKALTASETSDVAILA